MVEPRGLGVLVRVGKSVRFVSAAGRVSVNRARPEPPARCPSRRSGFAAIKAAMHDYALSILILAGAAIVAVLLGRQSVPATILPALLAVGWFAIVMLGGGSLLSAAIGLPALLPLVAGNAFAGRALTLPVLMVAIAFVLFALAHGDRFGTLPDIALMAAVGGGMLVFVLRSPETDRVPGIEGAHLFVVAIGIAVVAIDMQRLGAALSLPAMLAGAMIGCLLVTRPPGSAPLGPATAAAASLLVAMLLGDLALAGGWGATLVLGSFAALEIVVILVTAARADRSNDKDRPRGVYIEAMARQRGQRQAFTGTLIAGILVIILALGASQDE
jgi:hypothetical protein